MVVEGGTKKKKKKKVALKTWCHLLFLLIKFFEKFDYVSSVWLALVKDKEYILDPWSRYQFLPLNEISRSE